ncbi:hypothetical protein GGI08_009740, partial [Coemansia sp. S2]
MLKPEVAALVEELKIPSPELIDDRPLESSAPTSAVRDSSAKEALPLNQPQEQAPTTASRAVTSEGPKMPNQRDNAQEPARSQQDAPVEPEEPVVVKETPLPWKQIAPLVAMRLAEPINFTLILPFLYKMIEDFDVAETPKDISYYA